MSASVGRHFDRQLGQMDGRLSELAALVDRALALAVDGLHRPYDALAEEAGRIEEQVDGMDEVLESELRTLIALQAPVASDLRRLIVGLRIGNLLESIGDEARSVARRAAYVARHGRVPVPPVLIALAERSLAAYRCAVPVLRDGSIEGAKLVFSLERETDALSKDCYRKLREHIARDIAHVGDWSHLLRAVGRLEQIADLCAELVEEAVYLHQARSIRHNHSALA